MYEHRFPFVKSLHVSSGCGLLSKPIGLIEWWIKFNATDKSLYGAIDGFNLLFCVTNTCSKICSKSSISVTVDDVDGPMSADKDKVLRLPRQSNLKLNVFPELLNPKFARSRSLSALNHPPPIVGPTRQSFPNFPHLEVSTYLLRITLELVISSAPPHWLTVRPSISFITEFSYSSHSSPSVLFSILLTNSNHFFFPIAT